MKQAKTHGRTGKQRIRLFTAALLTLLLLVSLAACGDASSGDAGKVLFGQATEEAVSVSSAADQVDSLKDETKDTAKEKTAEEALKAENGSKEEAAKAGTEKTSAGQGNSRDSSKSDDSVKDDSGSKTSKDKTKDSSKSGSKSGDKDKSGSKDSGKAGEKDKTGDKGGKSDSTPAKPEKSDKAEVTVTVECHNAAAVKDEHEQYAAVIPDSGYIMGTTSVTLEDGDTAYDALVRAAEAEGVSLNVRNTGFGKYVAGIGGLNEKDLGGSSGWMYSVNGSYPNTACSNYELSDGDVIVFSYTVKKGDL